ncbi:hypothetical protein MPNTM1_03941 [Mycolicibacterium parafortuitum]
MTIQDRPAPAFPEEERRDNRLDLLDQAFYAGHRAAGQKEVMQVGWVYERDLDFDALKRFHANLGRGLLGRLIERSPLPFGRYRWVADPNSSEIDLAGSPRPRAELGDWFDERTQLPIDPESGPGWRLSVLPMTDGSTALSLVLSHYVIDGIGGAVAVSEAALGMTRDLGYPPPHSRTRLQALVSDAVATARDAPASARAFVAAVKEARRRQRDVARLEQARPVTLPNRYTGEPVILPSVWIQVDLNEWNARAQALGGTGNTLAAALTAKLDQRMGRTHGDADEVRMLLTVNNRTMDDVRAVAVSFARIGIDPAGVTTDLRGARASIKLGLKAFQEAPDESAHLVAMTPFTPQRGWRHLVEYALSDPERPAVCSTLGDTGPAAIRPDGTLCDSAFARGASQHLTRQWLERMGSQLHVYYGTAVEINKAGIYVSAYQAGSVDTKPALRELIVRTLAEFGLAAEIV